jgi:hypothetical protein
VRLFVFCGGKNAYQRAANGRGVLTKQIRSKQMVKEVCSPINVKGGKTSGNIPGSSPGAFSNPSRGDRKDSIPPQPAHGTSRHSEEPKVGEVKVTGPED